MLNPDTGKVDLQLVLQVGPYIQTAACPGFPHMLTPIRTVHLESAAASTYWHSCLSFWTGLACSLRQMLQKGCHISMRTV
jgi:hypothetical protein